MNLRKSLEYAGVSKCAWYYEPRPREIELNQEIVDAVKRISLKRPTYGTRRMAAKVEREVGVPVNRKQIQRIYRKAGYIEPKKTKNEIIRTKRKLFKPDAPNRLWQLDITYIWCGNDRWCYSFNVVDCFTRKWITYVFDPEASRFEAIKSINDAVAIEKPDCSKLRIRTDNGNQYASRDFRKTVDVLGIRQEFIWKNTPEQNGNVESFHKTLKKEYVWRHEFKSYQDAVPVLAEAFADYNNERIHSSIAYKTPAEFAKQWEDEHK